MNPRRHGPATGHHRAALRVRARRLARRPARRVHARLRRRRLPRLRDRRPALTPAAETRLTDNNDGDHDPFWSRTGTRLFITSEHGNIKQPYGDIYRLDSTTGTWSPARPTGSCRAATPPSRPTARSSPRCSRSCPVSRGPHVIDVIDLGGNNLGPVGGPGLVDIHPTVGVRADTDGDGLPDYLESGSVGVPKLRVPGRVRAGGRSRSASRGSIRRRGARWTRWSCCSSAAAGRSRPCAW